MSSLASEIKELLELHKAGALDAEEFAEAKKSLFAQRKIESNSQNPAPSEASSSTTSRSGDLILGSPSKRSASQRITLQIRIEQAEKTIQKKGEQAYFVSCFTCNFAGDYLAGAEKSLEVLKKVLVNLRDYPDNENYQTLKLSNEVVRKRIIQQKGALELLLWYGAEFQGKGQHGYEVLNLCHIRLQAALKIHEKILAQFLEVKQAMEEERRKKAEHITRAALQREARRLERSEEDGFVSGKEISKKSKGEACETLEQQQQQQRVTLDQALKYLTGK